MRNGSDTQTFSDCFAALNGRSKQSCKALLCTTGRWGDSKKHAGAVKDAKGSVMGSLPNEVVTYFVMVKLFVT